MGIPTAMKVPGKSTAVRIDMILTLHPSLSEFVMRFCWMDLSLSAITLRT
jgi:hypothetical protein